MQTATLNLITQYINGWKENNIKQITACLSENCTIIESHGPTYQGINEVELWFKFWLEAKSHITKWDILSFYDCDKENATFIQWDFACISNGIEYAFPGVSIIKFSDGKICFIQEYRMTRLAYPWKKDKLESA